VAVGVVVLGGAAVGTLLIVNGGKSGNTASHAPSSPPVTQSASPSAHPTSPSPKPVLRHSNCGPSPHRCGYPDATNTGVPKGMALRSVPGQVSSGPGWSYSDGSVNISAAGAVFEGFSVKGSINVMASHVTIKNVSISNFGNDIGGDGVNLVNNPSHVTIEHTNISSPYGTHGFKGIFAGIKDIQGNAHGTRVLDNNIADASTGVQIYAGLIRGNYIHDVSFADSGSHLNGTTSNGSTIPLRIEHNTVFNPNDQTDAISLFEDFGVEANVIINDNLVAGGGYAIYGGQNPGGPRAYNIRITNNRFSTIYYAQCGSFGYIAAFDPGGPGNVWSGNVWDNTSAPVGP
jgi:hypothetical protein